MYDFELFHRYCFALQTGKTSVVFHSDGGFPSFALMMHEQMSLCIFRGKCFLAVRLQHAHSSVPVFQKAQFRNIESVAGIMMLLFSARWLILIARLES